MKIKMNAGIIMAVICVLGFLQLCPFSLFAKDTSKLENGYKVMEVLSTQDYDAIVEEARLIEDRYKVSDVNPTDYSTRFSQTIIMGDSLSEGLIDYGLLPSSIVFAGRGKHTANIDEEIQTVISLAPKAIFMEFGINDLGLTRGNADLFIERYCEQIQKLQKGLPKTPIYINSLTPISQSAQASNAVYTHGEEFNIALKKMCKELKVTYIDNTNTLDFSQDVYEYDGIHPSYPYYPLWLSKMLSVAHL